jgi:hypothetical protein
MQKPHYFEPSTLDKLPSPAEIRSELQKSIDHVTDLKTLLRFVEGRVKPQTATAAVVRSGASHAD